MEVSLLKIPGMDVDIEEVDTGHVAVEFTFEHVKVFVEIYENCVEH